jgi:putative ABC transport system permease protein
MAEVNKFQTAYVAELNIFNTLKEYFKIAVKNLRTRQLRSWLTILGIVIGVFLIMSLLSLSQGLKDTVLTQLRAIGTDIVAVIPGSVNDIFTNIFSGVTLSQEDMNIISKTPGVEAVVPQAFKGVQMKYGGTSKTVFLFGADIKNHLSIYTEDLGFKLSSGRWLQPGRNEIVVGSFVPTDIFPGMKVGTIASIAGRRFTIVGILKSQGNRNDDSSVIIDLDIFHSLTGAKNDAPEAIAKIAAGYAPAQVATTIKANLEKNAKRRVGQTTGSSFSVMTSDSLSGIVNNVLGVIQFAVISFASIAIIVGGIGIMNTMYTSVRERTKEIGILKAVGAKTSTIVTIFLMEAGIIGLIGGVGGMVIGLGMAKAAELAAGAYIHASITPGIVIFGFLFSIGVGCLSGFFPARSASKLKPVDALRYE